MANVLVGILNSPPDVVKTRYAQLKYNKKTCYINTIYRMQDAGRSYTGTLDCMKSMIKNEGLSSFFRGSWLRIIRIAPGNICGLLFFFLILLSNL